MQGKLCLLWCRDVQVRRYFREKVTSRHPRPPLLHCLNSASLQPEARAGLIYILIGCNTRSRSPEVLTDFSSVGNIAPELIFS